MVSELIVFPSKNLEVSFKNSGIGAMPPAEMETELIIPFNLLILIAEFTLAISR